jgi:hypothetical protein
VVNRTPALYVVRPSLTLWQAPQRHYPANLGLTRLHRELVSVCNSHNTSPFRATMRLASRPIGRHSLSASTLPSTEIWALKDSFLHALHIASLKPLSSLMGLRSHRRLRTCRADPRCGKTPSETPYTVDERSPAPFRTTARPEKIESWPRMRALASNPGAHHRRLSIGSGREFGSNMSLGNAICSSCVTKKMLFSMTWSA